MGWRSISAGVGSRTVDESSQCLIKTASNPAGVDADTAASALDTLLIPEGLDCDSPQRVLRMKPIAILQHDPLQRPGYLLQYLDELAIPARVLLPCDGDDVPRSSRFFSGVVALGSDASANDRAPWA